MPKVRNLRVGNFMVTTVNNGEIAVDAHETIADALAAVNSTISGSYSDFAPSDPTDEASVSEAIGELDIDFLYQIEEITED